MESSTTAATARSSGTGSRRIGIRPRVSACSPSRLTTSGSGIHPLDLCDVHSMPAAGNLDRRVLRRHGYADASANIRRGFWWAGFEWIASTADPAVMFGIGPAYLFVFRAPPARIGLMGAAALMGAVADCTDLSIAWSLRADLADRRQGVPGLHLPIMLSNHVIYAVIQAVLCGAPVRSHHLGSSCGLELAGGRAASAAVLRSVGTAAWFTRQLSAWHRTMHHLCSRSRG